MEYQAALSVACVKLVQVRPVHFCSLQPILERVEELFAITALQTVPSSIVAANVGVPIFYD